MMSFENFPMKYIKNHSLHCIAVQKNSFKLIDLGAQRELRDHPQYKYCRKYSCKLFLNIPDLQNTITSSFHPIFLFSKLSQIFSLKIQWPPTQLLRALRKVPETTGDLYDRKALDRRAELDRSQSYSTDEGPLGQCRGKPPHLWTVPSRIDWNN